jgi:hypothetical protein
LEPISAGLNVGCPESSRAGEEEEEKVSLGLGCIDCGRASKFIGAQLGMEVSKKVMMLIENSQCSLQKRNILTCPLGVNPLVIL